MGYSSNEEVIAETQAYISGWDKSFYNKGKEIF